MTFKPLLISVFESAINRYLALDENRSLLLNPLAGKVIAITIQPFNETIYLCPTQDSIQVIDQVISVPDTTIIGSLWALGLMGVSAKPMRSIFSGEVKLQGDTQVGKQFQDLFKKLNINLEGVMAQYMGNEVADKISQFFRTGQAWSKEAIVTFKQNTAEFLQEETRDLPAKQEIDLFYQDVDACRNDCDRLECRIERLQAAAIVAPAKPKRTKKIQQK